MRHLLGQGQDWKWRAANLVPGRLTLFPSIAAAVSIYGLIVDPRTVGEQMSAMSRCCRRSRAASSKSS
jgi:hypothetical protein